MTIEQFITCVFCLIDDLYISLVTQPLRKRDTPSKLSDSEAIAIEITGDWLGFHSDKNIWKYFKLALTTGHIYFLSCLIVANLYVRPQIYGLLNNRCINI